MLTGSKPLDIESGSVHDLDAPTTAGSGVDVGALLYSSTDNTASDNSSHSVLIGSGTWHLSGRHGTYPFCRFMWIIRLRNQLALGTLRVSFASSVYTGGMRHDLHMNTVVAILGLRSMFSALPLGRYCLLH